MAPVDTRNLNYCTIIRHLISLVKVPVPGNQFVGKSLGGNHYPSLPKPNLHLPQGGWLQFDAQKLIKSFPVGIYYLPGA
jgi:hypothetical protein